MSLLCRVRDSANRAMTAWTTSGLVRVEALEAFAHRCDRTLLELAVGGLASITGVATLIAGATNPEQVRANAGAGDRPLAAGQLEELAGLLDSSH